MKCIHMVDCQNFLQLLNLLLVRQKSDPANERPLTSQKDLLFCNLNFRVTTHLPTDSI